MRGGLIGLFVLALTSVALAQDAAMPVAIGGGEGNACPSGGKAGGAIEVRVGPGTDYEVIDHLSSGMTVFVCESASGWYGVVYGKADCGVSKPITPRQAYIGACKTGWVSTKSMTAAAE